MLRPLAAAGALLVLLAGVARAQLPPPPPFPGFEGHKKSENALQEAESERQHKAALKLIPNRKASNDPWHNIRTAPYNPTLDRHRPE